MYILALLTALNWVYKFQPGEMDFELDSKILVDSFNSNHVDVSDFVTLYQIVNMVFVTSICTLMLSLLEEVNEIAHTFGNIVPSIDN